MDHGEAARASPESWRNLIKHRNPQCFQSSSSPVWTLGHWPAMKGPWIWTGDGRRATFGSGPFDHGTAVCAAAVPSRLKRRELSESELQNCPMFRCLPNSFAGLTHSHHASFFAHPRGMDATPRSILHWQTGTISNPTTSLVHVDSRTR